MSTWVTGIWRRDVLLQRTLLLAQLPNFLEQQADFGRKSFAEIIQVLERGECEL